MPQINYTTLHYTTLHYTTLHYTTLHYTTQKLLQLYSAGDLSFMLKGKQLCIGAHLIYGAVYFVYKMSLVR